MDGCLYDPADCESERTVIISELQGGENDPEQLLDTEVTATAFKVHPYHHPTIGWLSDLADHDTRGSVRALPALLRAVERHARDRRRRRYRRCAAAGRARSSAASPPARDPRACGRSSRRSRPNAGSCSARKGPTAYWKAAYHAPAFADADVLSAARGRRRAERRGGPEHLVEGRRVAAAAQLAAVSRPRRRRPGVDAWAARCCRPSSRISTAISATVAEGQTLAAVEDAVLRELDRIVPDGITPASSPRSTRSSGRASSSTWTA